MNANVRSNLPRFLRVIFALIFAVLTAGCSSPTLVMFVNASPKGVTVLYKGEDGTTVSSFVDANSKVEIEALLDRHFSVKSENLQYDYNVEMVPEAFIDNAGIGPFFKRVTKAQLESDGCIYLIAVAATPGLPHGPQPEGFPLCPKTK